MVETAEALKSMQPYDLNKAQYAVQRGQLADWQLARALQVFQQRRNPQASILAILVELQYLDREIALRLSQTPWATPSFNTSADITPVSPNAFANPLNSGISASMESSANGRLEAPTAAVDMRQVPTKPNPAPNPPRGANVMSSGTSTLADSGGTPINRPRELQGSERFGRYELRGIVAKGGMGTVYRAYHSDLQKVVALKTLSADRDEVDLKRFLQEARAAAQLRHANIVSVHDIGEVDGIHYFTMDLIDGLSLDEIVHRRGRFSPRDAASLCSKVSKALHYAHERGVVHRDIKPGNVIVENSSNEPFVTDFGLARQVESSTQLTKTGYAVGTPNYMAPEQASGQKDVDRRADVYGVGTLLYAVITGEPPFDGPNSLATMTSVLNDPTPSLRARAEQVDARLDAICKKALARNRKDRYQTGQELADALDSWLRGESSPGSATGSRRGLLIALGVLGILTLVLAGLAFVAIQRREAFQGELRESRRLRELNRLAEARTHLEAARALNIDPEALRLESERLEAAQLAAQKLEDERLARENERRIEELAREQEASARSALGRGSFGDALTAARSGLASRPQDSALLLCEALALAALGRNDEVEKSLASITSFDRLDPDSLASLAGLFWSLSNQDRLQTCLARLEESSHSSSKGFRALLELEQSDSSAARKALGSLADSAPAAAKDPWVALALTILIQREKRFEGFIPPTPPVDATPAWRAVIRFVSACAELERGARQNEDLESFERKLVDLLPFVERQLEALRWIGQELSRWRRFRAANLVLEQLRRRPEALAQAQSLLGHIEFTTARDLATTQPQLWNETMGRSLLAYEAALRAGDRSVDTAVSLVAALASLRRFAEADTQIRALLERLPQSASAHEMNFQLLYSQSRFNEAAAAGRQALLVNPGNSGLATNIVDCCIRANELDGAITIAKQQAEQGASDPRLFALLARCYILLNQETPALEAIDKAMKLEPESSEGRARRLAWLTEMESGRRRSPAIQKLIKDELDVFLTLPPNNQGWASYNRCISGLERSGLRSYARLTCESLLRQGFPRNARIYETLGRVALAEGELARLEAFLPVLESAGAQTSIQTKMLRLFANFTAGKFEDCSAQALKLAANQNTSVTIFFLVLSHEARIASGDANGESAQFQSAIERLQSPAEAYNLALIEFVLGRRPVEDLPNEASQPYILLYGQLVQGLISLRRSKSKEEAALARRLLMNVAASEVLEETLRAFARNLARP